MKTLNSFIILSKSIFTFVLVGLVIFSMNFSHAQSDIQENFTDNLLTIDNLLKLTAIGNGYSDQTIVVFVPDATPGFDSEYDAYKLMGIYEAPQLYSIVPCCLLAVNALPEITTNLKVQLGFQVGAETTYTLSATELYSFDPGVTLHLLDSRDNVLTNLMTDSVYTFTASPDDCYERFSLYFNMTSQFLNLNVFLEGPFNGAEMDTDLNSKGLIPLNQPYNTAPWSYAGTESISSIPEDAVDWMLLEFRDAPDAVSADSETTFGWQAVLLMSNGKIKSPDGCNTIDFSGSITNNLFVVVHHRNHLPVMSSNAVLTASGVYIYDFSTGVGQAYNGGLAHKDLGGGIYGMLGGDANVDGVIDDADVSAVWYLEAGENGYLSSDVTMDGESNNMDKDDVWYLNVNSYSQVP